MLLGSTDSHNSHIGGVSAAQSMCQFRFVRVLKPPRESHIATGTSTQYGHAPSGVPEHRPVC
jgi:hypothetical protein